MHRTIHPLAFGTIAVGRPRGRSGTGLVRRCLWAGLLVLLWSGGRAPAAMVTNVWQPVFKGIDHLVGTNYPDTAIPRRQVMHCLRVDLTDPDIQLLSTPPAPAPVNGSRETLSLTVTNFLIQYGVQAVINGNFYNPGDPPSENYPVDVLGLHISRGTVVSGADAAHTCALYFKAGNQPGIVWSNPPPGTNTLGFQTALTGFYPLVSNGVNIGAAAVTNYPDAVDNGDVHLAKQPRSVYGLSADNRFLYLMTIDGGPQNGYSEGALDVESAAWMLLIGGWNAINMDGGHSTAMYRADPFGKPVAYNHSNALVDYGRERYIGSHLGIFAAPYLGLISSAADFSTAALSYSTVTNAGVLVEYGLTPNYGSALPTDTSATARRTNTLAGLTADTTYYYRITVTVGTNQFLAAASFHTRAFLDSLGAAPGQSTATITWATQSNATSQAQFGTTSSYGYTTPLDPRPTNAHTVHLTGLLAGTTYYYRVASVFGGTEYAATGSFTTSNSLAGIFGITNAWKFSYANLDKTNWTATNYNEIGWSGPGAGLLWVDTRGAGAVPGVQPKNTAMPANAATSYPYPTYYFRTHFRFPGPVAGAALVLSNFVDDGAVFYLNGGLVYNLRLNPAPVVYTNLAMGFAGASLDSADPCHGNACTNCADVFTLSGTALSNLVAGDNVLAVEAHNYSAASPDITFGSALYYSQPQPPATAPTITLAPTDQVVSPGGSALLYVLAEGDAPLRFQWRLEGAPIPNATNNLLSLTNIQAGQWGGYSVVVTNSAGMMVSRTAQVQAPTAPLLSQVVMAGTNLSLTLPSQSGVSYVLETKGNLNAPGWTALATNVGNGGVLQLLTPAIANQSGFFRIRVQ